MNQTMIKKIFVIILIVELLLLGSAFSQAPNWVNDFENGTLNIPGMYHGINFAEYSEQLDYDVMNTAKKRAMDDLCYQLSVMIQSDFKEKISQKGDFDQNEITSALFITSHLVLSGVTEKDKWDDKRNHRFWILIVIDKSSADQQVQENQFMQQVLTQLTQKQNEIYAGMETIKEILQSQMQKQNDKLGQLFDMFQSFDGLFKSSDQKIQNKYSSLHNDLQQIRKDWSSFSNDYQLVQQAQSNKLDQVIAQNQKMVQLFQNVMTTVNNDYLLTLMNEDVQQDKQNKDFKIRIESERGPGAVYYESEPIQFYVYANQDCYIKVTYLASMTDNQIKGVQLFPNMFEPNNYVKKGQRFIVGQSKKLIILPPFGVDIVTVVASRKPFPLKNAKTTSVEKQMHSPQDVLAYRGIGFASDNQTQFNFNPLGNQKQSIEQMASNTCVIVTQKR